MGGISQDVKGLKCVIFTFHSVGFLDHLHFCCFDENYHVFSLWLSTASWFLVLGIQTTGLDAKTTYNVCFMQLEASHILWFNRLPLFL